MGNFNFTCAISKLPIRAGENIKCIFLNKNIYHDKLTHEIDDLWYPRSLPFSARYDECGSVYDYNENIVKNFNSLEDLACINYNGINKIKTIKELFSSAAVGSLYSTQYKEKHIEVLLMMIREDVWNKLLELKFENFIIQDYVENISFLHKQLNCKKLNQKSVYEIHSLKNKQLSYHLYKNSSYENYIKNIWNKITYYSLYSSNYSEYSSEAGILFFIRSVAEILFIWDIMFQNRIIWQPSYNCGDNESNFDNHRRFLSAILDVTNKLSSKNE